MKWRRLKEFPVYKISNTGLIWSDIKKDYITPKDNGTGYMFVILYNKGKEQKYYIHRLVASLFIKNPKNLPDINHKDEDKTNNAAYNLEWCDQEYNSNYGDCAKKISIGVGIKVIDADTGEVYNSITDICKKFKTCWASVYKCCFGQKDNICGHKFRFLD